MKRQQTLEAIEDNATRLVLERGFDDVTIEDICAEAGISKRTFFNYVESKEVAVVGPGPRLPAESEGADFLATAHEDFFTVALDLVIRLFGEHDNTGPGLPQELRRRRKSIRAEYPKLAMQHFARVHQTREALEELIADYLRRWPNARQLPDAPDIEAITIVGVLLTAIHQGSRAWHDMDSASSTAFTDCCKKALNDIFLLKGESTQ